MHVNINEFNNSPDILSYTRNQKFGKIQIEIPHNKKITNPYNNQTNNFEKLHGL